MGRGGGKRRRVLGERPEVVVESIFVVAGGGAVEEENFAELVVAAGLMLSLRFGEVEEFGVAGEMAGDGVGKTCDVL